MKNIFKIAVLIATTVAMSFKTLNPPEQVTFYQGTWKDLFTKAEAEKKPVMVYMTATWCGLCEFTEDSVFSVDSAYNLLNEKFICYKVDEKSKEAKKIRADYPIEGYPCYYYFDTKGKLLRQTNGFMFANELQKDAGKALKKFNRGF